MANSSSSGKQADSQAGHEVLESEEFHKKLLKRNKEAFRLLYEHYKVPMYSVVFSMLKNREKTADIIQDTFIRAIKKIHQLQDVRRLKSWIFRIAVNLTINLLNKEKRYLLAGDDMETFSNKVSMEHFKLDESDDADEMRHLVLELVERLPVKQQVVFNLKYVEGFKETEIAEIVDIPVGTVKSRLNIARNRVKEWLKEAPQ